MSGNDMKAGDKVGVRLGDTALELTGRGGMMDAVMGADCISIKGI